MNFKEAEQAYQVYKALTVARKKSTDFRRQFKKRILNLQRSQKNPKTGGWFVSPNGLPGNSGRRFDEPIDLETFFDLELDKFDRCYFERGHIYNFAEYDVTVDRLTFGAYGSGARPIFLGSDTLSGATWTSEAGGYYSTPIATPPLWVVNPAGEMARQGESDYIQVISKTNNTTLVATTAILQAYNAVESLVGAKMSGKEFNFRWSYQNEIATYNGTNTITLVTANTGFAADTGFKLSGQKQFATLEGDWWYDTANAELWIKTASDPTGLDWRVVTENYAFNVTGHDVTIDGIEFTQYYENAINTYKGSRLNVNDFYIHDIRTNGLLLTGNCTGITINNGEVERCGLNAIFVGAIANATFSNLELHDIGNQANFGWPIYPTYTKQGGAGIVTTVDPGEPNTLPDTCTISNCIMYDVGNHGVHVYGNDWLIEKVEVYNHGMRFDDTAGIGSFYVQTFGTGETTGTIQDCIVHDGIGSNEGMFDALPLAVRGFYIDNGSHAWTINRCAAFNNPLAGINANWDTEETTITNCLLVNNGYTTASTGAQIVFRESPNGTESPNFLHNHKNVVTNNVIVSNTETQIAILSISTGIAADANYDPFDNGGSCDNNQYIKPYTTTGSINFGHGTAHVFSPYTGISFASWQSRNSTDASSTQSTPYLDWTVPGNMIPGMTVAYNPTNTDPVVYDLEDGAYTDKDGTNVENFSLGAWEFQVALLRPDYYYLLDAFTAANGTTITGRVPTVGNTANVISGTHSITSNNMVSSANGLVTWDVEHADYIFELIARREVNTSTMRQDFRLADNTTSVGSRLSLQFTASQVILYEDTGSGLTSISTQSFTVANSTFYRIRAELNGTNVKVYIAGALIIDATTAVTTGTWAGIFGDTNRRSTHIAVYPLHP